MKAPPPRRSFWVWISRFSLLLTALFLVAVVGLVGQQESEIVTPSVIDPRPGGLAAWGELLTAAGYRVTSSRDPSPRLAPTDVLVLAFRREEEGDVRSLFEEAQEEQNRRNEEEDPELRRARERAERDQERIQESIAPLAPKDVRERLPLLSAGAVSRHLAAGGTVLLFETPRLVSDLRPSTSEVKILTGGEPIQIRAVALELLEKIPTRAIPLLGDPRQSGSEPVLATAESAGSGMLVRLREGRIFSNLRLGEAGHATAAVALAQRLAPAGSKWVFAEMSFGNAITTNYLDELGPWAATAAGQAVLLLGLVFVTLAIRFGPTAWERVEQRSARAVVEAVRDGLARSPSPREATWLLLGEAETRIRRSLGAAPGLPSDQLMRLAPPPLAQVMASIRQDYARDIEDDQRGLFQTRVIPRKRWLEHAQALQRELVAMEREGQSRRAGLRRPQ